MLIGSAAIKQDHQSMAKTIKPKLKLVKKEEESVVSTNKATIFSFLLRVLTQTRIAHWQVQSYSQHVALSDYYNALSELLDELVETYQGRHGIVSIPTVGTVSNITDPINYYKTAASVLSKESFEEPEIQNIFEEIIAATFRLNYKLTNLK